jgi:Gpi18-like mannosyltransferase
MPLVTTSIVVAAVVGVLAVWAVYALGEAHGGVEVARGAALLVAAWPGSAAFDLPYTESLFLASAGAALVCLHKRWWILAGLLGAVASATRPNGLAVAAAAVVAAGLAILREREWKALLAPALSVSGAAAFVLYGWRHSGDPLAWRHAENLWHQRLDFNAAALQNAVRVLGDLGTALGSPSGRNAVAVTLLRVLGLLLVIATLAAAWANRRRLSLPVVAYTAVSLAMILGYSTVGTRPRMVLTVLPAFVWLAAWLPRRAVIVVAICLLPLLGVVTYLWAGDVVVP